MARLLLITGIIIAFVLGLHFYAQWEMKKFEASLPKPPAPKGTADVENAIENQEKFDTETSGIHWHVDEWHATPHPPELTSNEHKEQTVQEEHSPLEVPIVDEPERIEDSVAAQLQLEKLELDQLGKEVNDISNQFRNDLVAQNFSSIEEADAICEEINRRLRNLHERRYQWLRKYEEHHGTQYQGPEEWAKFPMSAQMVDEAMASIKGRLGQETPEEATSRGYILLPVDH